MSTSRSFLLSASLLALIGGVTLRAAPNPVETKALAVLTTSQDVHEKARACQELAATTTSAAAVPALAALLDDEQLSDYARSALESIPDPSAGKALRDALPKLQGRRLAGAVNSLGARREKTAVAELRTLALDSKRGVAAEAVASLGFIGTPEAAKVLQDVLASGSAELRVPTAHAALVAAELLAKEGNRAAARTLLQAATRALPAGQLANVTKARAAALATDR